MGGRGSSSMSSGSGSSRSVSPIGDEAPIEVTSTITLRSGRKETILAATANGTELTIDYSRPVSRERPNRSKTVETHELKSGFYTETWGGRLQTHNVDLSKATVVRGQTFAIKELLKSEGFRWDSASKEWRKNA